MSSLWNTHLIIEQILHDLYYWPELGTNDWYSHTHERLLNNILAIIIIRPTFSLEGLSFDERYEIHLYEEPALHE